MSTEALSAHSARAAHAHAQAASYVGVAIACAGNILISLAL